MTLAASLATVLALLPLSPAFGQEPAPQRPQLTPAQKQANCRKACDEAVKMLRDIPATPGRDQQSKDALERKVVALIEENRRKGVDHCDTWSQVMGLAFKH